MAKLIWNRCPNHRMDMERDYDDNQNLFIIVISVDFLDIMMDLKVMIKT